MVEQPDCAFKPLTPSPVSLSRLIERSHQLHERTADLCRLREYVRRWLQWHHSGLRGLTARTSQLYLGMAVRNKSSKA